MSSIARLVFITQANRELSKNMNCKKLIRYLPCDIRHESHTAKPTRVAIDELQLHDLKNIEAGRVGLISSDVGGVPLTCCRGEAES